ncbi:TPA: ATP-binding protein, partial [Pasteurella multocida]|nr:ATP-binding protein [Pasteurella multocida]
ILRKCRIKAKIFLDNKDIEGAIGDLQYNLAVLELERLIFEILSSVDKKVIILMDKLDEGYEPDNIGIGIIAGFAYAVIELNQRTEYIRPIIFLRDNIFRALSKEDPDYSRNIEGQVIRLHWDWSQLLKLATQRMRVSFDNDKEKDQKVWDLYTADELKGRSGFKKCLQFTLYRPRDLLSLLNESFYCAFRDNRNIIINNDLEFAAKTISISRLEDLWKEYNKIFPSIQYITSLFRNNEPQLTVFSCLEIISNFDKIPEIQNNAEALSEINLLNSSGILQSLYSVGFIGVSENNSSSFAFCHDGRTPDKGFKDDDRVLIHPCYWIALNLSQKVLSPEEAETINDEYDINIISSNPEIRNKKIGQIVSALQKIAIGSDGALEFENWCVDALNIIFASHLTDIRKHPNKNSVQRRDIVGANMGSSAFWSRVLTDYKTRQVIFEVKNYQNLDGDVYRQLQSYLTAQYGKLAFIINRENTEELTGKSLDWMKEMYDSHNVLIVKMPARFIIKLLQKIRSPNKHDVID